MIRILAAAAAPFNAAPLSNAATRAYGGTLPNTTLYTLINGLISAVFGVLGLIFLFLTLYAGYLWMTAMGDSKKVTRAKDMLAQAVIGLIIVVLSYGISFFVVDLIGTAGGFGGT
ncbi:MAG: hypothetical protein AAB473_04990 [Patescibacteria group bacterium]